MDEAETGYSCRHLLENGGTGVSGVAVTHLGQGRMTRGGARVLRPVLESQLLGSALILPPGSAPGRALGSLSSDPG